MVAAEDRVQIIRESRMVSTNNRYRRARDQKRNIGNEEIEATHTRRVRARQVYVHISPMRQTLRTPSAYRRNPRTRSLVRAHGAHHGPINISFLF